MEQKSGDLGREVERSVGEISRVYARLLAESSPSHPSLVSSRCRRVSSTQALTSAFRKTMAMRPPFLHLPCLECL